MEKTNEINVKNKKYKNKEGDKIRLINFLDLRWQSKLEL